MIITTQLNEICKGLLGFVCINRKTYNMETNKSKFIFTWYSLHSTLRYTFGYIVSKVMK